jgi:hypothetical protein
MLDGVCHVLPYLHVNDALENFSSNALADGYIPVYGSAHKMVQLFQCSISLDRNDCRVLPFIKQVISSFNLADHVDCFRGLSLEAETNDSSADDDCMITLECGGESQNALHQRIHACPVVIWSDKAKEASAHRLEQYFDTRFRWLEQHHINQDESICPSPYFRVQGSKWWFGFARKRDGRVELCDELIASMAYRNGRIKIAWVLQLVLCYLHESYRQWFQEGLVQMTPSKARMRDYASETEASEGEESDVVMSEPLFSENETCENATAGGALQGSVRVESRMEQGRNNSYACFQQDTLAWDAALKVSRASLSWNSMPQKVWTKKR